MIKNKVEERLKLRPSITDSSHPLTYKRHLGPEGCKFAEPLSKDLRLFANRSLRWDIEAVLAKNPSVKGGGQSNP